MYGFKEKRDALDLKSFIQKRRLEPAPLLVLPPERRLATEKVIVVKNTSGETCPKGGLLRIISEAADPNDDRIYVVTCGKPNGDFALEYLVSLWDEIPDNTLGFASELIHADWVLRSGLTATHRRWGAKSGEWGLTSGLPGFIGMGTATKTVDSINYIRVKQQIVPLVIGKANGIIGAGATDGSVNVMIGSAYSSNNGQTIEDCFNPAFEIADNALVSVGWPQGYPIVTALTCPEA